MNCAHCGATDVPLVPVVLRRMASLNGHVIAGRGTGNEEEYPARVCIPCGDALAGVPNRSAAIEPLVVMTEEAPDAPDARPEGQAL